MLALVPQRRHRADSTMNPGGLAQTLFLEVCDFPKGQKNSDK